MHPLLLSLLFIVNYECVNALTDVAFYGLQFGIKLLVKSFGLKIEPGGRKGFEPSCIAYMGL